VYYSVIWWRSIHPSPVVGPLAAADALNITMLAVLLFSMVALLFLFVYLVLERSALRDHEDQLRGIRFMLRRTAR